MMTEVHGQTHSSSPERPLCSPHYLPSILKIIMDLLLFSLLLNFVLLDLYSTNMFMM